MAHVAPQSSLHACTLADTIHQCAKRFVCFGQAGSGRKHEVCRQTVRRLHFPLTHKIQGVWLDVDGAIASFGLRWADLAVLLHSAINANFLSVKVDVLPLQAAQLTLAHTGCECDRNHCTADQRLPDQAVTHKALDGFCLDARSAIRRFTESCQANLVHWVARDPALAPAIVEKVLESLYAVLLCGCAFALITHSLQDSQPDTLKSLAGDELTEVVLGNGLVVDLDRQAKGKVAFCFAKGGRLDLAHLSSAFDKCQEVIGSFLADSDRISFDDQPTVVI